jgi:hypothetical protein
MFLSKAFFDLQRMILLFIFLIQKDHDQRMIKQNLDMIKNIIKDLHTKYYSSIMTFVQ